MISNMSEKTMKLMELTGCEFQKAKQYIEMSNGDVNRAFSLYTELEQSAPRSNPPPRQTFQDPDEIRSPIPQTVSNLMYDGGVPVLRTRTQITNPLIPNVIRSIGRGLGGILGGNRGNGGRGQGNNPNRDTGNNRRKKKTPSPPPPSLIDGSKAFGDLYGAPDYVFEGNFGEARRYASEKGRFLLCNIISENVFSCLSMQADVWKATIISEFVKENFVFFQRDVLKDESAMQFRNLYFKNIYKYPYTCIIDPRTGEQLQNWVGEMKREDMFIKLVKFVQNNNSFEDSEKRVPSPVVKPSISENKGLPPIPSNINTSGNDTDDQIMQMVLRESLKESNRMEDEDDDSEEFIEINDDDSNININNNNNDNNNNNNNGMSDEEETQFESDEEEIIQSEQFNDEKINIQQFVGANLPGDKTRIQLRLPDRKREVVTILKSAPLAVIYAVFRSHLSEELKKENFQVVFFNRVLDNSLDKTLMQDKVINASLSIDFE